jgi:putative redox protein
MVVEATLSWQDGLSFRAHTARGELAVGSTETGVTDTFGPKELVAMGLAGCTAMDVASIFEKMRVQPERFEVAVVGESEETHPKRMVHFALRYRVDGEVTAEQARRAVTLSLTRYCGVSATLAASAEITTEIVLNGETLADTAAIGASASETPAR